MAGCDTAYFDSSIDDHGNQFCKFKCEISFWEESSEDLYFDIVKKICTSDCSDPRYTIVSLGVEEYYTCSPICSSD